MLDTLQMNSVSQTCDRKKQHNPISINNSIIL